MRLILSLLFIISIQAFLSEEVKAQSQVPSCPSIIIRDEDGYEVGGLVPIGKLTFTLNTAGSTPNDKPSSWKVSGGKIVNGQGSSTITVETGDSIGAEIIATLDVSDISGLSSQCDKIISARVRVGELFCPIISISCPNDAVKPGDRATVSVNISGGNPHANPIYKWEVSAGKIVSGQGMPTITIDTAGAEGQSFTATVEVDGFEPECDKVRSCSFIPWEGGPPPPQKLDEYGNVSWINEETLLANLATELQRNPASDTYVIIYGPHKAEQHLARIRTFLVEKRGLNQDRVFLINGGYNKKAKVELWIVPVGSKPPKPNQRF